MSFGLELLSKDATYLRLFSYVRQSYGTTGRSRSGRAFQLLLPSSNGLELSDDEKMALEKLSGIDKAAILMLSLSEDDAATLFRNLQPKQVQKLGIRMAELQDFNQDSVNAVHKTFLTNITKHSNIGIGSEDFVKNALVAALGEDKANNLVDQINMGSGSHGLDSLKWMDARQVATIIQNEHPQIQTIVLSYFRSRAVSSDFKSVPRDCTLRLNHAYCYLRRSSASCAAGAQRNYGEAICWFCRCSDCQDWWLEVSCKHHELPRQHHRNPAYGCNPGSGQGNGSTDSRPHVRIREPGWCGRSFYSDLAA